MKEYKLSEDEYIRNYVLLERQIHLSFFLRTSIFFLIGVAITFFLL